MIVYTDTQTPPAETSVDRDAIPAGFKAALKAWLNSQGPQRMARCITWGLDYCATNGAPNVMPARIRQRIENIMQDWHPAPAAPPVGL